jgi:hypothetical protein
LFKKFSNSLHRTANGQLSTNRNVCADSSDTRPFSHCDFLIVNSSKWFVHYDSSKWFVLPGHGRFHVITNEKSFLAVIGEITISGKLNHFLSRFVKTIGREKQQNNPLTEVIRICPEEV